MLGEILRRRGVRAVTWFHADHWEPFGQGVNEITLARVESFTRQAKASPFASKMTLFYLTGTQYRLKDAGRRSNGEEILEAEPRSEAASRLVQDVLGQLRSQTNIEFQVHLHHEHLVGNDGEWNDLHRSLKVLTDPAQDARRLDYLLRTELATLRQETGAALDKWAFVHGMWALNGSDRTVCQIDNEIEILMKHGCWGDFTFPAGRNHCDPTIVEQPYTCVPLSGAKGYDDPRCEPIVVDVGANAIRNGRFLIWNSKAKHDVCSLDYYNANNLQRVKNADHIVFKWLSGSPVIDDVLYIKTHAHSMDAHYFEDGHQIPLTTPDIEAMFDLLRRACEEAKVELKLATVDEVMTALRDVDSRNDPAPHVPAASALDHAKLLEIPLAGGLQPNGLTEPNFSLTNLFSVTILGDWLASDPGHERSAGNYYMTRLSRGQLFVDAELTIAKYSRKRFVPSTRFVELGFGFGELSLMLALSGFRVTGFESDAGRHAGASALIAGLGRQGLNIENLALIEGLFPDALRIGQFERDGETVFVSTNVTSSHVMENLRQIYRALRLFDHLIIDLSRFGTVRDEQLRHELILELGQAGFVETARVYTTSDTDIRHFQRKGIEEQDVAALSASVEVEELRYSDIGAPVPRRLLRAPFHIFEGNEVLASAVLPRLHEASDAWLPSTPIRVGAVAPPSQELAGKPPMLRESLEPGSGRFVFDRYGGHSIDCSYGVFKCLTLDPNAGRDERALAIFRFAAENIVHSCVDKAVILPWAKRTRYVRPDLLLSKLFLSDQPLAVHCDHAAQVTAYLLHLAGYKVREVSVVDPEVESGHVVMETFLPELDKWIMLDPDYGVVVTDHDGVLLGTAEIIACTDRRRDLEIRRVVIKRWAVEHFNVCEAYGGQLTWTQRESMGPLTVEGDSYYDVMDRVFLARREFTYRFEDGFEDSRLDAMPAAGGASIQLVKPALATTMGGRRVDEVGKDAQMADDTKSEVRWADRLQQLLVPVLLHKIERHGTEATGAYNFYKSRLDRGLLFLNYELAIARKLLASPLGITRVDEIGSGFGQLPFLLGWNGIQAIGFESDQARARTARCLRGILELADPELTKPIVLSEDEFPSPSALAPGPHSLILTTNLVATRSPDQQATIVRGMRQYSFALVDVQRLFEKREGEAAQKAALALFSEAGFPEPELFIDLGDSGRYYLFDNRQSLTSEFGADAANSHAAVSAA